jgi:transcriptional regulator GlxA family with amidase domain
MKQGTTNQPRIIPVFMVVPPFSLLIDIAGPIEVLRYANEHQEALRFEVTFVGSDDQIESSIGLHLAGLKPLPEALPDNAWVVVSGAMSRMDTDPSVRPKREQITEWLRQVMRPDLTLITICSGALLAAEAGLFDQRSCTTHGDCIDALKRAAPLAKAIENRLFVSDGNFHSSGGISTGIDLMLHLVALETSHAVAASIAKTMVIYTRRSGSDPQISPWLAGRNHIHPAIHRVQDAVMHEPRLDWTLARLADLAHMSERNLSRLFRDNTQMSLVDYVNLMRVSLAHDILSNSHLDIESVAEKAGFTSARHMRRIWQQHYDVPPSLYRRSGA